MKLQSGFVRLFGSGVIVKQSDCMTFKWNSLFALFCAASSRWLSSEWLNPRVGYWGGGGIHFQVGEKSGLTPDCISVTCLLLACAPSLWERAADCATNIKSCQEGDFPIKYIHSSSGQLAVRRYDSFRCSWLQDGHAFSVLINLSRSTPGTVMRGAWWSLSPAKQTCSCGKHYIYDRHTYRNI